MSYDKNGIMTECSKCESPICEHNAHLREELKSEREENEMLRENFDDEKNQEDLKEIGKLMDKIVELREIVRKQTATLKDYFRPTDFTASGYEAKCKAAIKLGEGI